MLNKESPPYIILINILETCPWAIFTYYILWKNKCDKSFTILKNDIEDDYIISPTLFKEYLFDLSQVQAISYKDLKDSINIEILYPNVDAEGYILC
jgi:hypothetical protein